MLQLQEDIIRAAIETKAMRRDLAKAACEEYFRMLGTPGSGLAGGHEAAQAKALSVLKAGLFTADILSTISGGTDYDEKTQAKLALSFDVIAPTLRIPQPPVARDPKIFTLAVAALAGAFIGALGLSPLLRWAFDVRELGVVLGGPVGAFVGVLLVHRISRIRALLRFWPGKRSGGRSLRGSARRDYEAVVRASVEPYLDWAVLMLAVLCAHESARSEPQASREAAFRHIGKLIYTLHRSGRESLPVVADELIKEAMNCGFEGLEGPPAFAGGRAGRDEVVWSKALQNKYETFGHVAEGDRVMVERPPVVFSGKVVERGLVRKVRDQA